MIDYCAEEAKKIPYIKGKHRVYTVITDKKGNILSESSNDYHKSSPHMKRFAEQVGEPEKIFWHAECRAIHYCPYGKKPYKITIARINKNGRLLPSAPCSICEKAIKNKGIKIVEYHI